VIKHKTDTDYLNYIYKSGYTGRIDICNLNRHCANQRDLCDECVLNSEHFREEFNRITENKTKLVTVEEVQESINILVILG